MSFHVGQAGRVFGNQPQLSAVSKPSRELTAEIEDSTKLKLKAKQRLNNQQSTTIKRPNDMEKQEKTLVGQASPEQIEAWKRQHGEVFSVTVDDGVCYLKKPSRKALGYASFASKQNPLNFNEAILNDCWLGGDETIRTDDAKFFGISGVLAEIIEVKEAEIKKL